MSIENERDPRVVLTRDKYFSVRPKPLEQWIWKQGVPQAAERIFWLHWEEGSRRRDWCSELALKYVARACCVDTSTVTRAYQLLKKLELIRREDPGRAPDNAFQQATAITEVRVPRDLLLTLSRQPNRTRPSRDDAKAPLAPASVDPQEMTPAIVPASKEASAVPPVAAKLSRGESQALMKKLSPREMSEFFLASRDRRTAMPFEEATTLTAEERGRVLELLGQISAKAPTPLPASSEARPSTTASRYAKARKLSPLEAARLRKSVLALGPAGGGGELFRQVLWSVEEGALRRFEVRHAINIAIKKIREGAWSRPNRMPPNWLGGARTETCTAA